MVKKSTAMGVAKLASPKESPMKARLLPSSMRENLKLKKEKPVPPIHDHGFLEPFAIEAYEYIIKDTKPGFVNKYRLWAKGQLEVEALTKVTFVGLKMQQDKEDGGNELLKDSSGYS
jgi:hypothetical protein